MQRDPATDTLLRVAVLGLALALISSSVAVRVEDTRSVSADDQASILQALSEAIEARSGRSAAVDRGACKKKERCVGEVAQRTQAEDVVSLRMLGVPTRIRILAEREGAKAGAGDAAKKSAEIDLPRSRDGWGQALAALAEELFEAKPLPAVVAETPPLNAAPQVTATQPIESTAGQSDTRALIPWIAIGAGVVCLAVGTGFGLSSRGARDEALAGPHDDSENRALEDRAIGHGLAADIMFGLSALGIGGGVVLLALD